MEVASIIIEALLTKRYRQRSDSILIQALAILVVLLKEDGIMEA